MNRFGDVSKPMGWLIVPWLVALTAGCDTGTGAHVISYVQASNVIHNVDRPCTAMHPVQSIDAEVTDIERTSDDVEADPGRAGELQIRHAVYRISDTAVSISSNVPPSANNACALYVLIQSAEEKLVL